MESDHIGVVVVTQILAVEFEDLLVAGENEVDVPGIQLFLLENIGGKAGKGMIVRQLIS
jgi:hypothetical protein